MTQKMLIFSLMLCSSVSLAKGPAFEPSPIKSKDEIYKEVLNNLDQIGEKTSKSQEVEKRLLINRISDLSAWTYSKSNKQNIKITSGVFSILSPPKTKLSPEEHLYTENFSTQSYATGFLYKNYIVTNYHACRGMNILIRDFNDKIYGVELLKYDIKQDVCILKAPEGVLGQRDFADYKMPINVLEEEKNLFRLDVKIGQLNKIGATSEASALEKEKQTLASELKHYLGSQKSNRSLAQESPPVYSKRNYGQIIGVYGQDYIYEISVDNQKDKWSKDNSYLAYGKKCLPGMSGAPIVSVNGLEGLFWGSAPPDSPAIVNSNPLSKNNPHLSKERCYFLRAEEIDKVIAKIEIPEKVVLKK